MLYVLRVDGCHPLTLVDDGSGFVGFSNDNLRTLAGAYYTAGPGTIYNIEVYGYWDSGSGINPPDDFWYNNTAAYDYEAGWGIIYTGLWVSVVEEVSSNIPLSEGWNLVSLDVKNGTDSLAASEFVAGIPEGDRDNCVFVIEWDGTEYNTYTVGVGGDFDMFVGQGYWVYMALESPETYAMIWGYDKDTVGGELYPFTVGWNLIGWFNDTTIWASAFCDLIGEDIGNGGVKWYLTPWDIENQDYDTGYLGGIFTTGDFELAPKLGYWIWIGSAPGVTY